MVEICSANRKVIFVEGNVTPDRSPKTCAIARDYGDFLSVFLENENRQFQISCTVLEKFLDTFVLGLELAGSVDFLLCKIKCSALLALCIDKNRRFCDSLVGVDFLVIAHRVELALLV